jgi:hypothetical protein
VSCVQALICYTRYPRDLWYIKTFVGVVWCSIRCIRRSSRILAGFSFYTRFSVSFVWLLVLGLLNGALIVGWIFSVLLCRGELLVAWSPARAWDLVWCVLFSVFLFFGRANMWTTKESVGASFLGRCVFVKRFCSMYAIPPCLYVLGILSLMMYEGVHGATLSKICPCHALISFS